MLQRLDTAGSTLGSVLIWALVCAFIFGIIYHGEATRDWIIQATKAGGSAYFEAINVIYPPHEVQASAARENLERLSVGERFVAPEYKWFRLPRLENALALGSFFAFPRAFTGQMRLSGYKKLIVSFSDGGSRSPQVHDIKLPHEHGPGQYAIRFLGIRKLLKVERPNVDFRPLSLDQRLLSNFHTPLRCLCSLGARSGLFPNGPARQSSYEYERPASRISPFNPCMGIRRFFIGAILVILSFGIVQYRDGRGWDIVSLILLLSGLCVWTIGKEKCDSEYRNPERSQHNPKIVQQKLLTFPRFRYTVIIRGLAMANVLNTDKQIAIISALSEGSSIRSIERMTGVHRDTIMRLGVKVGEGCTALMDAKMRNLSCTRLEMDEIWGFVGKKERHVREGDAGVGSVWTFCAIDAETKLVPAFRVGNRDAATANAFVKDVAERMAYRVQLSTDGLNAYVNAVESSFGGNADYAQIIKTYGTESVEGQRRYSQPEFVSSEKKVISGRPNYDLISTSYIERLNATTRLHMRRLTRLTLAFSKKRENFEAAVGLHFAYYNFVKRHNTLRCTPAMAAGVTGSFWSVGDLLEAAA